MNRLDANVVLRYMLKDNADMSETAKKYIAENKTSITIEVIAEIVYVLASVYKVLRNDIKDAILAVLAEVETEHYEVVKLSLEVYSETKFDYIDCVLYAYHKIYGDSIFTFDKKLQNLLTR